jgi:hypothetical protein
MGPAEAQSWLQADCPAAVWGAHDRATGNIYLYDAYLAPRTDLWLGASYGS